MKNIKKGIYVSKGGGRIIHVWRVKNGIAKILKRENGLTCFVNIKQFEKKYIYVGEV